jgi:3alpha(or 20beta)-hydroxysteroid dehydrogenase
MGRLDDKVAIVTGAARGTGALTARRLVEDGARVVLADVLDDRGKPVAEELGDAARYLHLDITDEQQWQGAVDFTLAEFGGLTTLVNNAAILHVAPIEHTSLETYTRVLQVNGLVSSPAPGPLRIGRLTVNAGTLDGDVSSMGHQIVNAGQLLEPVSSTTLARVPEPGHLAGMLAGLWTLRALAQFRRRV